MSWWDPIVDWFSGGGGDAGVGIGDVSGGDLSQFYDAGPVDMPGLSLSGNLAQDMASSYGGVGGLDFGGASSGAYTPAVASNTSSAVGAVNMGGASGDDLSKFYDSGGATAPTAPTSAGLTATGKKGLGGFLDTYGSTIVNGMGALTNKTGPAPSTVKQQGQLDASNQLKSDVGTSMVNQAPFVAQNSMNAAKISGDASKTAAMQSLARQGYGPGSAQAQALGETYDTDNSKSTGTAYAAGQSAGNAQAKDGATMTTPTMSSTLGDQQNAQQIAENKNKNALLDVGLTGLGKYANS